MSDTILWQCRHCEALFIDTAVRDCHMAVYHTSAERARDDNHSDSGADLIRLGGMGPAPCLCTHDPSDIRPGAVLRYEDCCRKKGIKFCQPAPVVERFVMWDKAIYPDCNFRNDGTRRITQCKRGDVVARQEQPNGGWVVDISGADSCVFDDCHYQWLKRNGCFGEQVNP